MEESEKIEKRKKVYDLIVIGGGPAGLSAALYGARADFSVLVIEQMLSGGQIAATAQVENYPGFPSGIGGMELGQRFEEQARRFGAEMKLATVEEIKVSGASKIVKTTEGEFLARVLIIATGTTSRPLDVAGEEKYLGRGVSYCATCDGPFFREKEVAVIGGGDAAVEEALYLTRFARKVYIIHRRHRLRAVGNLADRALASPKIEVLWDTVVQGIKGGQTLEGIFIGNVKTGQSRELLVAGVFVYIGRLPHTAFLKGVIELDDRGYIMAGENTRTSVPGIFAAGDVRCKSLRQVVTAAADGAVAANEAARYLEEY